MLIDSIGMNAAMYFMIYLYGGARPPPYNYVIKYIASFIPIESISMAN